MKNSWVSLSFIGLASISVMTVIITYLVRKDLPTAFVLFLVGFVVIVVYGGQILLGDNKPHGVTLFLWLLIVLAGILSAIGNLAIYRATAISPNPGLVITILGLQGGIVAVLAVIFLKDKLNVVQLVGVLVGIVAVALIGYGSRNTTKAGQSSTKSKSVYATRQE